MTFHTKIQLVKNLCFIILNKMGGFVRNYNGAKYLVLFGPEKYDPILNRIRYPMGFKCSVTYVYLKIRQKSKLLWMMICL